MYTLSMETYLSLTGTKMPPWKLCSMRVSRNQSLIHPAVVVVSYDADRFFEGADVTKTHTGRSDQGRAGPEIHFSIRTGNVRLVCRDHHSLFGIRNKWLKIRSHRIP